MHITSLPSPFGIGDLGPGAYRFADFLATTKQHIWQVLPLNPTDGATHHAPYSSISSYAGNPLCISPEFMVRDGWLTQQDIESMPQFSAASVRYDSVQHYKDRLFNTAFQRFRRGDAPAAFHTFCNDNVLWLEDFSLFEAVKKHFNHTAWYTWEPAVRERQPAALTRLKNQLQEEQEYSKFLQFIFFQQWFDLKRYVNEKSIQFFGDMPLYVSYDSVDVWKHPDLFKLDSDNKPAYVAGVPPDYFSATGQLWGNPVYDWDTHRSTQFEWWVKRLRHQLRLYDLLRIDHFRGLVGYWEVPVTEKTAINGRWVDAYGSELLETLQHEFSKLPIVAEDLGVITDDVRDVMKRFQLPGMRVLLFAFGDDVATNAYAPHNLIPHCIAYTGTHDNNTTRGWYEQEASHSVINVLHSYIGRHLTSENVSHEFIKLLMMSAANTVIIPLQDVLNLGIEARMNTPGTVNHNWMWRVSADQLTDTVQEDLAGMTEIHHRG